MLVMGEELSKNTVGQPHRATRQRPAQAPSSGSLEKAPGSAGYLLTPISRWPQHGAMDWREKCHASRSSQSLVFALDLKSQ